MGEATLDVERAAATGDGSVPGGRRISPRRGLPSGRAVVGGFLMALAGVGVFVAHLAATAPPETSYLVATRGVGIGQELTERDLGRLVIDLPAPVRDRAVTDPAEVLGTVAAAPIDEGDLILASMVRDVPDVRDEVSFSLPAARVFGEGPARLRSGEHVDVVATYGTGRDAVSCVVTRDNLVLDTDRAGDALGGRGQVTVLLGVDAAEHALALTHAVSAGQVSLVRVTGRTEAPETACMDGELGASRATADDPEGG